MDWNIDVEKSSLDTDATLTGYQEGRDRQDHGTLYSVGQQAKLNNYKEIGTNSKSLASVAVATGRDVSFSSNKLFAGSMYTWGYNLVGIKAGEVENMRNAIRDYVNRVQNKLNETLQSNDIELNKAIRGAEVRKEVNTYIDKVKAYCQNVISGLLVFSDKLADVGNAWITATENLASTVSATSGAFSEGTKYTESVQYRGSADSTQSTTNTSGGTASSRGSFSGGSGGHYSIN